MATRLLGIAALAAAVTGCAVGGNTVDQTMVTSATSLAEPAPTLAPEPFSQPEPATASEADRILDEDTIRLAVTTIDLDRVPADGAAWANAATGASGRITEISELQVEGQVCRTFSATRQAYDGQSLYKGQVCLDPRGGWWTRNLAPVQ